MNEIIMNSSILYQPNNSDPQEIAIRKKLENSLLITDYAKDTINQLHDLQEDFFINAFKKINDGKIINESYQELLQELSDTADSKIISGENNLDDISSQQGVIIITNHLGLIKLTKINNFEPFPLRHAPLLPIAKKLGFKLYETAIELPYSLSKIQKACDVLIVNPEGNNRTQKLIDDTSSLIKRQKSAIVMYPEGGTSGKRNNGGPYDLDKFHTGAFVVAKRLGILILPICQYFNPESGFELDILEPINLQSSTEIDYHEISVSTREKMQTVLDNRNKIKYLK